MTPSEIRFTADGMLQSLGAWLRLMGCDCVCQQGKPSRALLEQAVADERIFLTRNAHLWDNLPRTLLDRGRVVSVLAEHLPGQVREVVTRFAIDTESFAFTRCIRCNVLLEHTGTVPDDIPPNVAAQEKEFWHCPSCRQTFWRGSHVHNSLARLRNWLQG